MSIGIIYNTVFSIIPAKNFENLTEKIFNLSELKFGEERQIKFLLAGNFRIKI